MRLPVISREPSRFFAFMLLTMLMGICPLRGGLAVEFMDDIPDLAPPDEVDPFKAMLDDDLFYKVALGEAEDVRMLLERGADPNAVNEEGQTPLTMAAEREDDQALPIAEYLADNGADLDGFNLNGDAALHVAIRFNKPEMVHLLLSKGANFHLLNSEKRPPLDLAYQYDYKRVTHYIEEAHRIEKEREDQLHSDKNFKKMLWNFNYYTCKQSYLKYYVESGQDEGIKDDPEYDDAVFTERQDQINAYRTRLLELFHDRIDYKTLDQLGQYTTNKIYFELDRLISNKYRKKQGVGTPQDVEKRCLEIADGWQLKQEQEESDLPTSKYNPW